VLVSGVAWYVYGSKDDLLCVLGESGMHFLDVQKKSEDGEYRGM